MCKAQCPAELDGMANVIFTPSMGCVWADPDDADRYSSYEEALGRCKEILGGGARLAEILSAEDQAAVVEVMAAAESMFVNANVELSYWWSGLKDADDDAVWDWAESGPAEYTNWSERAVPEHADFNCMQLLSGTTYGGEWMTFLCGDDYINTHPLCQLK
eukprot:GFUD01020958.1.p1 GENE.GFUD01020958.1~~GFUD01020958.1.p1  ORF type:complete len:185 (+),score=55.92 GFUD01020958.1:78-557(+)